MEQSKDEESTVFEYAKKIQEVNQSLHKQVASLKEVNDGIKKLSLTFRSQSQDSERSR